MLIKVGIVICDVNIKRKCKKKGKQSNTRTILICIK